MNALEDARIGKYISVTGVIHVIASCGGKRGPFGTSKASGPITEEDIVYWGNIEHKFCARCNEVTA